MGCWMEVWDVMQEPTQRAMRVNLNRYLSLSLNDVNGGTTKKRGLHSNLQTRRQCTWTYNYDKAIVCNGRRQSDTSK